jgi:SpoIID/LytB domain protein
LAAYEPRSYAFNINHIVNRSYGLQRTVASLATLVMASSALVASTAAAAAANKPDQLPAFPASAVTFQGHGNGPGYGMGQWGAFGYAAFYHWTYQQILAHYYSDSAHPVTAATLSGAADNQTITAVDQENDGQAVVVTSPSAFTVENIFGVHQLSVAAGQAMRAVDGPKTGLWSLQTGAACGKTTSWKTVALNVRDPIAVPASQLASASSRQLLTLCRGDGTRVTFRGEIEALDYTSSHYSRTLDRVPLEQYVADVTPSESPAGWASYGGTTKAPQGEPWGFQELEAQAVAARTYVLYSISVGGWYGYADICDDVCQSYSHGIQYESAASTTAAADTKGLYLVQNGSPAPTEYGSSSGGYTETLSYSNGTSIFTGVPDAGDGVCIGGPGSLGCNPEHTWTASVPVGTIQGDYPSIGTLESVKVTAKDASGRVTTMQLVGQKATATLSGQQFIDQFAGFLSTLFVVTNGPGATAPAGARPHVRWLKATLHSGRIRQGWPGAQAPVGGQDPPVGWRH